MIGVEKLSRNLIAELAPIVRENHNETGQFKDLCIDWDMYLSLGSAFVATILRNSDLRIIGYLFYIIGPYPHNYHMMMGQQVSIFVEPSYRKFSNRLMKYAEEHLKHLGVELLVQAARINTPFCKVLERSGYKPTDVTYCKRLS